MSNVSSLNKTKRESDLLIRTHKSKCFSENFNKGEMDFMKRKTITDNAINLMNEKNLKEVNKTEIGSISKKSMMIPSFKFDGLKRKFSLKRNSNKEAEIKVYSTERNFSREREMVRKSIVDNIANKNMIKKFEVDDDLKNDEKIFEEKLKKVYQDNKHLSDEKNEEFITNINQSQILKEPAYFSSLAKNLSKTVSNLNQLKFFNNIKENNEKNKNISLITNSLSINEDNTSHNNIDKTSSIKNQTPQINEITFRRNESIKKSNSIDLEIENNIKESTINIQSTNHLEFSFKNRYRIKKTDHNLSFDLIKQILVNESFTRPKAKTEKVKNLQIHKKFLNNRNLSSSKDSIVSVSNYHNSDDDNENIYLIDKINNISDPEELIGYEIKEKVKDILDTIVSHYPNNELEENSQDESIKRNSIFTIFNYRPSRQLTIKRKKLDEVMPNESGVNEKTIKNLNSEIKGARVNNKHHTISRAVPKININNLHENNFFPFTSEVKNFQNFDIFFKKGSSQKWDPSSGIMIKSPMNIKNDEVDFRRQERINKFLKTSNSFIEKNYVIHYLDKQTRKNTIIKFYRQGLSKFFTKMIVNANTKKFEKYRHNYEKIPTFVLSRKFNDFLFDKYFDLFKELLIEVLNQENNFYELDVEGNKIGKTLLENFKLKQEITKVTKKRFLSEFKCFVKRCNTGQGILKHFGIKNHVFVNNFVIRDCFHGFQENDFDNQEKVHEKLVDNTVVPLSDKKNKSNRNTKILENTIYINKENNMMNKRNTKQEIQRKKSWTDDNLNTYLNYINIKEKGLKLPRRNKNNSKLNIHKLEMLTTFSVLNNKSIFNRQNKVDEDKSVKKSDIKKAKKQETIDSPMTKENTLFRTNEIKLKMLKLINSPIQLLWFFIKDGNFHKFKETFEGNKIYCEIRDEDNNSLLNLAVQSNNYEIAEYLISYGANVNSQNNEMNTPLHYAIAHKNFKISDLLINKNANEELLNKNNLTPWQCIGGE